MRTPADKWGRGSNVPGEGVRLNADTCRQVGEGVKRPRERGKTQCGHLQTSGGGDQTSPWKEVDSMRTPADKWGRGSNVPGEGGRLNADTCRQVGEGVKLPGGRG